MKLMSRVIVMMFFASLCLFAINTARAVEGKIAYMDLAKVFDEYNKTKDLDKQLKAKGNNKKDHDDMAKTILKDIKDAIVEIAKKEGHAYILDSRSVLFGNEADDLTGRVLKMLNDQYAVSGKK